MFSFTGVKKTNIRKTAGFGLYFTGILLGILKPPIERLACMILPSGEVCTGINTPLLALELGLVMFGSVLAGLSHGFRNTQQLNGWLGLTTGLGAAFIGGHSGIWSLFLFGVVLSTLGLMLYRVGRQKNAGG